MSYCHSVGRLDNIYILGLTYLHDNKFHPRTVMPICLPPSQDFDDTKKQAMAVGMGITRDMQFQNRKRCFTDGNGPEVFQQCAPEWVDRRTNTTDKYGKYVRVQRNCLRGPPPSTSDQICKTFHERIKRIR